MYLKRQLLILHSAQIIQIMISKIEIFTNDQECITPITTGNYNDDDYTNCPDYTAPYPPSGLWGVTLQAGQYYVVVDGFGGYWEL